MDYIPFADKFNAAIGTVAAVLAFVFGEHWGLFLAFLVLNILDFVTGCIKSRLNKTSNSLAGLKGVLKKLSYWIMILVAFGASAIFIEIGEVIGVNLGVTTIIGWFVLASLIINEFRSVLENLVEAGVKVPAILVRGLKVAEKLVKKAEPDMDVDGVLHIDHTDEKTDKYNLELSVPLDDLDSKESVTFKIDKK